MGLAIGVEFGDGSDYASKPGDRCREAGLLVSTEEDNLLTIFPPLTIEREVVRQGWTSSKSASDAMGTQSAAGKRRGGLRVVKIDCLLRSATPTDG